MYTDDFGTRKGDNCLVADFGGKVIGAVWTRIMDDYGHVDDETPSFAISLYKEYRGQGIGSQLMVKMLELLKWQGYERASTGGGESELCGEAVQECRVQDCW